MRKKILVAIATLISLTSWAVTTVESQPGKLESLLTDHSITSLKVTGTIDARDFKFIADNLLALSEIDLSEVTIAAYCNEETATFGADNNFAAASIPCTSFFGKSQRGASCVGKIYRFCGIRWLRSTLRNHIPHIARQHQRLRIQRQRLDFRSTAGFSENRGRRRIRSLRKSGIGYRWE